MARMSEDSVDAIVTDPPYGIGFMGREWDTFKPGYRADSWAGYECQPKTTAALHAGKYDRSLSVNLKFQHWVTEWATEALRVLKPGGYLLVFGGTRTFHRLTCALEDAGFEIRDCLMWLYGSGFPKSLNVSKAIDKAAEARRERTGTMTARHGSKALNKVMGRFISNDYDPDTGKMFATAPATDAAKQWSGWGTALKPAWEPIILARKPLSEPTVAANVLKWGTGAMNIDGCRIETHNKTPAPVGQYGGSTIGPVGHRGVRDGSADLKGRWPANVVLDEAAAAMLDEQSGECPTGAMSEIRKVYKDAGSGGVSRFFYCAKASRKEREAGLDSLEIKNRGMSNAAKHRDNYNAAQSIGMNKVAKVRNTHPTVKPISLMRYLCRLVTPPGGVILDPFAGTFTTGIAADLEGFDYILIEKERDYAKIGSTRLAHYTNEHPQRCRY